MKKIRIPAVALLVVLANLLSADAQPEPASQAVVDSPFAQNMTYVNTHLGFEISGPKGWYGAIQSFDPSGNPLYPQFPKGARFLCLKYVGAEERHHPFNPMFTVKVFPREEGADVEVLKRYISKIPPQDFLVAPRQSALGESSWAVAAYTLSSNVAGAVYPLVRNVYLMNYKDALMLIEATDTEQEYAADSSLFDAAISGAGLDGQSRTGF